MSGWVIILATEILIIFVVAFLPISKVAKISLDILAAIILTIYFNPTSAPPPKPEDSLLNTEPEITVTEKSESPSKPDLVIPNDYPRSYLITYGLNEIMRKNISEATDFPAKVTPYNY